MLRALEGFFVRALDFFFLHFKIAVVVEGEV